MEHQASQASINPSGPTCDLDPEMALLPARLHDLSLAEPSIAHHIFKRVAGHADHRYSRDVHSLRGACRLLRSSVNNTVGCVWINLQTEKRCGNPDGTKIQAPRPLELTSDLGITFPNAVNLSASLSNASSPMELAHCLTGLPELCPTLLPRLQSLSLDIQADHLDSKLVLCAINCFLSK
jgi:hypothetical protein